MSGSTLNPPEEGGVQSGKGHGTDALGPSDSSDTGSDVRGARSVATERDSELDEHALEQGPDALHSDTDRAGTGERASAEGDGNFEPGADILPDDVAREAGDVPFERESPDDEEI